MNNFFLVLLGISFKKYIPKNNLKIIKVTITYPSSILLPIKIKINTFVIIMSVNEKRIILELNLKAISQQKQRHEFVDSFQF